jgi:hypothetical protein
MKRKILVALIVVALLGVGIFQLVPALADSGNPLDHVTISPPGVTLAAGASQQFTAQAYDAGNQVLSNVSYFWLVTAGGGTISSTGNFTAGGISGTYLNTVEVVAVQGTLTRVAVATVTVTGTAGVLNHVIVTPASTTVAPGGTRQFTAQGYDVNNIPIPGLVYSWSVVAGGGTIDGNGLFTAGMTSGTFNNTVEASVTQGITANGLATVIVTSTPTPTNVPKLNTSGLLKMFQGYIRNLGFDNFLGGQWQIKNGTTVETIKVIPGIIQTAPSAAFSAIVIIPNGQTAESTFSLNSGTIILPQGTTLAANDEVVLVTVNDELTVIAKITPNTSGQAASGSGLMPPGLAKKGSDFREGKAIPPGWSHGKKTGWGDNSQNNNTGPEADD